MIAQINGTIISKNPPEIILDVLGVGYELICPMSTFYSLQDSKDKILLHTQLIVKEDSHTLYGFITKDEKSAFKELIKVNGVGPKAALAILSSLNLQSLIKCIEEEDVEVLSLTPGIGKKTANKIIIELKDRIDKLTTTTISLENNLIANHNNKDFNKKKAVDALQSLGFKVKEANKMITNIEIKNLSTEEIIRQALKNK